MSTILHLPCDRNRFYHAKEPQPFKLVSAILRLGTKYEMGPLRQDALSRLEEAYPAGVDVIQEMPSQESMQRQSKLVPNLATCIDTVNLAREMVLPHLVPLLLFRICNYIYQFSMTPNKEYAIWNDIFFGGVPRDDGTLALLSTADRTRLMAGMHRLNDMDRTYFPNVVGAMAVNDCSYTLQRR